uniref:Uncharacterized protein n=1 Tax=Molossus molossus TaxID=27622 RepID=A0A7J8EPI8_MOLMO|nr:hypothetical protein HJG59_003550 [Molossus molossus]
MGEPRGRRRAPDGRGGSRRPRTSLRPTEVSGDCLVQNGCGMVSPVCPGAVVPGLDIHTLYHLLDA